MNEHKVIGLDIVKETEEKVRVSQQMLKVSSDRQSSYADLKRKDLEYEVGDKVFLKVSSWRKILRFGKKGIEPIDYHLDLPLKLAKLHNVFHISMLHRYRFDESHILPI